MFFLQELHYHFKLMNLQRVISKIIFFGGRRLNGIGIVLAAESPTIYSLNRIEVTNAIKVVEGSHNTVVVHVPHNHVIEVYNPGAGTSIETQ